VKEEAFRLYTVYRLGKKGPRKNGTKFFFFPTLPFVLERFHHGPLRLFLCSAQGLVEVTVV